MRQVPKGLLNHAAGATMTRVMRENVDDEFSGCAAPAGDDGVCKPRVRRRLLSVGRPAPAVAGSAIVDGAARRLLTRHVAVADPAAAVEYMVGAEVSCVLLHACEDPGDGLSALADLTAARDDVPVVLIGAHNDPSSGVAAVQAGAQDYVFADGLDEALLERTIRYAIDRHRTRTDLARMALQDHLTGAANRTLFADRLEHATRRRGSALAVLFVDIDGFKRVNDHLGHSAGDRALRAAATRIRAAIRPADTLARFGGDEFTVLCEDVTDEAAALTIAERIAAQVSMPLEVGGAEVVLGASVGVAVDTCGELTGDELVHRADQAMYDAKHRGGARAELWQRRTRRNGNEIRLEAELRHSVPDDLRAVYQPQVLLADGTLEGAEALVRWEHPERGLVSPGEFIPVAERSGLIVPLGQWMLKTACVEAARLSEISGRPVTMSVNVSGRQMADDRLIADVEMALMVSRLPPEQLQLELTESTLIEDLDAGVTLVGRLKALGVSLALDDFGTGYSSLSYLKRLPVDTIKIDRSFVSGIPDSREDLAIVAAVISFGRALGMKVLAEGVETEAHVEALLGLGCTHAQGFYYHRPIGAEQLRELWAG